MKINKMRQRVLLAIQNCPEAANDDAKLLEQIWLADGWSNERSLYDNLRHVTRPETISRRRRELHNLGLIEYSTDADKFRYEAFNNERMIAGVDFNESIYQLDNLINNARSK